jgi:hypothetical protein
MWSGPIQPSLLMCNDQFGPIRLMGVCYGQSGSGLFSTCSVTCACVGPVSPHMSFVYIPGPYSPYGLLWYIISAPIHTFLGAMCNIPAPIHPYGCLYNMFLTLVSLWCV